jgi:hypothetical protein
VDAAASYVERGLIRICLDASGLQRKTQHMHDISLLQDDPSSSAQTYKVSTAKNISFDVREGLWLQEWH